MKIKIYTAKKVQEQWNDVWANDSIERNLAKLDYPEYWAIFDKYIKKDGKLLEAGSGFGKWVNYFHTRGYDITGVDYSEVAVGGLKNYNSEFKVMLGDITNLPFEKESFDTYLSFGVLEHLEEEETLKKAISEMHRVLRHDGVAIITIPYLNWANFRYARKNNKWARKNQSEFFEYNYTIKDFLSNFDLKNQFTLEEIVPENVPLILKRNPKYMIDNPKHPYDTNLNEKGIKRWEKILKMKNNSFIRQQNSHLIMYVLRKK